MEKIRSLVSVFVLVTFLVSTVQAQPTGRAKLSNPERALVLQLESSSEFSALIEEVDRIASQEIELRDQLDPSARRSRQLGLKAARDSVSKLSKLRQVQLATMGMTEAKLLRLQQLVESAKQAHPELVQLSEGRRVAVLEAATLAAMKAAGTVRASGSVVRREQPAECDELKDDYDACLNECKATWFLQAGSAYAAIVSAMFGCAALGPAWPICAAIATATYLIALGEMQKAAEDCVRACEDWYGFHAAQLGCDETVGGVDLDEWYDETESPSDYCRDDDDCPSDQFCWKGVATIGRNECRDEKSEGKSCSRHGQCESNCCKYHVWTNPVSKVCRPASKC